MARRLTRLVLVPTVIAVCSGALVGGPAIAEPEGNKVEFRIPEGQASKNNDAGDASEVGEAMAKAQATKKRVEIRSERDERRTLFVNPDGTMTQETSEAPRFAETSDGVFEPLDSDLTPEGGRLEPKVSDTEVSFSANGAGELTRLDLGKGRSIGLGFDGELAAPTVDGAVASYDVEIATPEPSAAPSPSSAGEEGAAAGASLVTGTRSGGFFTHVTLDAAPTSAPEYRFPLKSEGLTPVLEGQVLSFKDGDTAVAQSRPLKMWDAQVDEAGDPAAPVDVDASLVTEDGGPVLVLRPSMKWLQASERQYPVVIDPDIAPVNPLGDTWVFSNQASNDPRSTDPGLRVGSDDGSRAFRSIIWFRYNRFVGTNVTKATLNLKQYFAASGCTAKPTIFTPTTSGDSTISAITWSNKPTQSTDNRWRTVPSFNRNGTTSGCAAGPQAIDVTSMVNGWSGKHDSSGTFGSLNRQSIQLLAGANFTDEQDATRQKRFCSSDWVSSATYCDSASVVPTLSITYDPEIGSQSWYSMTDHPFNSYSSLSVNNRNGNLLVSATDGKMNGVGPNLDLARTYNSQATVTNTSIGKGWNLGIGPDIWLRKKSSVRFDYNGPSGTILGSFVRKSATTTSSDYKDFTTPIGGIGSELEETDTGFTLTFKKSRQKFDFDVVDSSGNAYLTKIRDRSDNEITFGYDGTVNNRPKLATITDSGGHVLNVTYTGNTITAITESTNYTQSSGGARTWAYAYDSSGRLTGFTNPENKTTTYAYTSGGLLSRITGPARTTPQNRNNTGETEITYGFNSSGEAQVQTVRYRWDDDASTAAWHMFTWAYPTSRPTVCDGNGSVWTTVKDPRTNVTTYCFGQRNDTTGKGKTWVYDPKGDMKSQDYTADNAPDTFTSATGATTVNTYSGGGLQDRLESVTEPKNSSGENAASAGLQYNDSSTSEGGAYLPTAAQSASGDCNEYGYDSKGRTTTAYTGITPEAATSTSGGAQRNGCKTSSSGFDAKFERRYNDNGTVSSSWDGNAQDSPTDAEKTIYTYWASTDTGYVAGSKDQLKSVRKPGGDCSTGSSRKLCTSFTYDGAARVKTTTDGRGKVTEYQYDRNDNVVRAMFDTNDLSCSLNLGVCINYTYDAEQNLLQRSMTTASRNSAFYYDRMNRLVGKTVGVDANTFDFSTSAYDGVGNMTYDQTYVTGAPDSVEMVFYHDSANRLYRVLDYKSTPTFRFDLETDKDGRVTSVAPTSASSGNTIVKFAYDYTMSGRPKSMRWLTPGGTEQAKVAYNYSVSVPVGSGTAMFDTPQMQSRTTTGSGAASNQTGTIDYDYDKQRLVKATDSNGTDYEYSYDKVSNITKEIAGSTTTRYGYNKAGILCWQGNTAGDSASPGSATAGCPSTPSGNTTINADNAGNSLGSSANPITVNQLNQVDQIDGNAQTYLDQGNDLRQTSAGNREYDSGRGVTGIKRGNAYEYYIRDTNGTLLGSQIGSSLTYAATEPNGNITWLMNSSGTRVGSYKYAPYGATTATGTAAQTNTFRWLGAQQGTKAGGGDGHYKLGARYYNTQGQFSQPDPIAGGLSDPRTLTGYNYATGDPINNADPSGYFSFGISGQACYGICIGLNASLDDSGTAGFGPSLGFGSPGVSGQAELSSANNGGSGPSLTTSCSFGNASVSYEALSGTSSASLTSASSGQCSVSAAYTQTFEVF
jgi:RHS repeat-associated protein